MVRVGLMKTNDTRRRLITMPKSYFQRIGRSRIGIGNYYGLIALMTADNV